MAALLHSSKNGMAAGTAETTAAVAEAQVPPEAGHQGGLAHQEARKGHMCRPTDAMSVLHIACEFRLLGKLRQ